MDRPQKKTFWALMVTQFFGAFNDNVLKTLIQILILKWVVDMNKQEQLIAFSGAVFVAPFLIFSMLAGRIADRSGKPQVMVATKWFELVVVCITAFGLWAKSIPFLLIALFLIAAQSALFSPSKYGVLP